MRIRNAAAATLAVALLWATAGLRAQPAPVTDAGSNPASVSKAPAAAAACTACHGAGGNSPSPDIPSIAGQPRTFLENQLVLIREGLREVPTMQAVMGMLDDAAISALARHFAAQPALSPSGAVQAERFQAGAAVSRRALCGTCHLPDYSGQSGIPRLALQHEAYLATTLKMYRDNPAPGRDTAMSAVLYGLNDDDLANLAHYFAHQGKQPAGNAPTR